MIYRIITGSREQIRRQISTLAKNGMEREKDYEVLSALALPDPSPEVGDLPGTVLDVWETIVEADPNRAIRELNEAQKMLEKAGLLLLWCEGGWQRSAALGEALKRRMERRGHTVEIEHLGVKP